MSAEAQHGWTCWLRHGWSTWQYTLFSLRGAWLARICRGCGKREVSLLGIFKGLQ